MVLNFKQGPGEAAERREYYRDHDRVRSQAHERIYDHLRDGEPVPSTVRATAATGRVNISPVRIPGRDEEDMVIWAPEPDGDIAIIYIGPRHS